MHHHLEIVMPPTDDVATAVGAILKRFDENDADNDQPFFDWWVIGGRWSGAKRLARYDKAQLDEFYKWCQHEKVTVSGVQAGKQELHPASQIAKVDAEWQRRFPSVPPIPCPLFAHSNDQYGQDPARSTLPGDVAVLKDVALSLEVGHVIIAAGPWRSEPSDDKEPPEAMFMIRKEHWNGVNHVKTNWDGTLGGALRMHADHMKHYRNADYVGHATPKDDWLVVTVDYHS